MTPADRRPDAARRRPRWAGVAEQQHGAVSRRQLLDLGLSRDQVRWLVGSGRFQPLLLGVYATFTGPVPWRTRLAAALLYAGPGAVIGGRTALRLHGVLDRPAEDGPSGQEAIEVCIPRDRRVVAADGLVIRTRRGLAAQAQDVPWPPRLRVEEAVLDVVARAEDEDQAIALVLAAVQRRRTTPQRLRAALDRRTRMPRRSLLREVLTDASRGVHSLLERRYLRDVEQAHGLPRADRQHRSDTDSGPRYRDLRYRRERVVVELDGEIAHPQDARQRDAARNRGIVADGDVPLAYGWAEVAGSPCTTAAEVAAVLRARGWTGTPHPCGRAGCPFPPLPG